MQAFRQSPATACKPLQIGGRLSDFSVCTLFVALVGKVKG